MQVVVLIRECAGGGSEVELILWLPQRWEWIERSRKARR